MTDIELLIAFKRAEVADIIDIETGDCSFSEGCDSCPASLACEHVSKIVDKNILLGVTTNWSIEYANLITSLTKHNTNTRLSTLQRHYPEYFI